MRRLLRPTIGALGALHGSESRGTLWWPSGSSIGYTAVHEGARHAFAVLDYHQHERAHRDRIELTATPCNYGGVRWWAECPQCDRRVAVLWGAPWLCRECHGLAYSSSQRSKANRPIDRGWDLRERFGPEDEDDCGGLFDPPEKPKGMHARTYDRLCAQLEDAEERMWAQMFGTAWASRRSRVTSGL